MNSKIKKLLLIVLLSIISLIIPNSVKADSTGTSSVDKSKIEVSYTIKIKKIDTDTKELLKGAEFELKDKDEKIVRTATTDENGELAFEEITTYGPGTDTYYIEEISTPDGYSITEKETIEVNVKKTIEDDGSYKLKIECQTLNYSFDISRYSYIPVSTVEQLKKIGSNELVEYEGTSYLYSPTANYQLVNDIDLKNEQWTPIKEKISGIFNGNGYSIKNLNIVHDSNNICTYSEVGLFRYFSGIVQGLHLDNVKIVVTSMEKDISKTDSVPSDTLSGKIGVGAFAGFMEKGVVKDCTVNGQIVSYYNNVGGFVGHSKENNIIKFQNCTSSVKLTSASTGSMSSTYNAGGIIGCAVGSVSFDDCTFNGTITGNGNNVGGLAGFVESTGYEEYAVKAGYVESGNEITLLIGNSKITGKYDLILQNRDIETLGLIEGAKYTVYNSYLEKIKGLEEIKLEEGELKLAQIDIKVVGTDIFYIKELEPAPGYNKLNGYIKLIVTRYWDTDSDSFRVSVDVEKIEDSKIDDEEKNGNYDGKLESSTGKQVSAETTFENVGWNNAKGTFINCVNKGSILGNKDIGGILGTAYCKIEMNNCKNYGEITGTNYGKAGGLVAEITSNNESFVVKIEDCLNEGNVNSYGSTSSSSGIAAHVVANINIKNCINKGKITGATSCAVSGMLADLSGTAEIRDCVNEGFLNVLSNNPGDVNSVVGGMVAKNHISSYMFNSNKDENNIYVYNCKNTGNIQSANHCGGMIGMSEGNVIKIENCENEENYIKGSASDSGGMIGFASVKNIEIKKCNTKNTQFSQTVGGNYTYGQTGGIIGNFTLYNGSGKNTEDKTLIIDECDVTGCIIESTNKETGGILGGGYIGNNHKDIIKITNCDVENCEIRNVGITGTYGGSGGILGATYSAGSIEIKDCNVKKCNISTQMATGRTGSDTNCGGAVGISYYSSSIDLGNILVEDCKISNGAPNDSCGNTGGIIAEYGNYSTYSTDCKPMKIDNCDVINSDLTALSGNLAGTVAMIYYTEAEITNCDNIGNNLNSTSTTSSNSNTAGIVAMTSKNILIDNCKVQGKEDEKSSIYGRGRNVTGILGANLDKTTVKNVTVSNIKIKSEGANYYSSSYSCDTVAGVIGYSSYTPIIDNCTVNNAEIEGIVADSAGVIACSTNSNTDAYFKNITVSNTNVSNDMTYLRNTSNSTASGIIGYNANYSGNMNYEKIIVEGCNITGSGIVTSGMIAVGYGGNFVGCEIKDTTITKKPGNLSRGSAGYSSMAGIISASNDQNLKMTNCKVENLNISGDCYSQGGFVGSVTGIKKFDNNTVNGLNINCTSELNTSSNGSIGGMIADLSGSSTTELSINDCSVTNFIAESGSNHIGGIIGVSNTKLNLNNCDVEGLDLSYTGTVSINPSNPRCVGGLLAVASEKITIDNSSAISSNFKALAGKNSNSSVGTFIGYSFSSLDVNNKNNVTNVVINDCILKDNIISNESGNGFAGGVIGANYCYKNYSQTPPVENYGIVEACNINISGCEITSTAGVGGLIGYGVEKADTVNVDGCTIKNNSSNNGAGGIVGMSLSVKDNSIENCNINDSSITSKFYAGGIAGFTSGKINSCTVTNTPVTSDSSNGCVGGIAGFTYDPSSTVNNSIVSGSDIYNTNDLSSSNYYVGGIVGFTEGNLTKDKVIEKTKVHLEGINPNNAVGGILGMTSYSSGEINDCSIEDIEVIGKNGYVGGIVGESNNIIHGCDVNSSTIKSESESSHGCGGIIGCGDTNKPTVINDCTIEDSTVEAHDHVGAIYGMGISETSCDCTVENVTVIEDGQSRVEPQELQSTSLELESQDSEEIMYESSTESNIETEEPKGEVSKEQVTSSTNNSVEETEKTETEETISDSEQDTNQDSNDDSSTDIDENTSDTQEGQDSDLDKKEEEKSSDEVVESDLPDMVEPSEDENGKGELEHEEEKVEENPDSEPEVDISSENLQMPKENIEQDLQPENETSGEQ